MECLRKEEESGRGGVYIASLCLISISSPQSHMSDRVKHEKQSFPFFYCREMGELVATHRESRPGSRSARLRFLFLETKATCCRINLYCVAFNRYTGRTDRLQISRFFCAEDSNRSVWGGNVE
jgi:hypothetical protein